MITVSKTKIARSLTTSASACRALRLKSTVRGVNMDSCESIENQISLLRDIPKRVHIAPTFKLISKYF